MDSLIEAGKFREKVEAYTAPDSPLRELLLELMQDNIALENRLEGVEETLYQDDRDT